MENLVTIEETPTAGVPLRRWIDQCNIAVHQGFCGGQPVRRSHWRDAELDFREGAPKVERLHPRKLPKPNKRGSSSNHHFSGAMLNFRGVSELPWGLGDVFYNIFFRKGTYRLKHQRIVLRNSFHLGVLVDDWGMLQVYEILYVMFLCPHHPSWIAAIYQRGQATGWR